MSDRIKEKERCLGGIFLKYFNIKHDVKPPSISLFKQKVKFPILTNTFWKIFSFKE